MGSTSFEPYQFLFFSIRLTATVTRNSKFIVYLYKYHSNKEYLLLLSLLD